MPPKLFLEAKLYNLFCETWLPEQFVFGFERERAAGGAAARDICRPGASHLQMAHALRIVEGPVATGRPPVEALPA